MAPDTDDNDITEFTERNEETKLNGIEKKKEMDILLTLRKTTVTKL